MTYNQHVDVQKLLICKLFCHIGSMLKVVNLFYKERFFIVLTIKVIQIGSHIYKRLGQAKAGKVHSVFNTSFNLIFDDRLIHIGSIDQGLAPFGIGLRDIEAKTLTKLVKANERVFWQQDKQCLLFECGISLGLKEAPIYSQSLTRSHLSKEDLLKRLNTFVHEYVLGDHISGLFQSKQESLLFFKKLGIEIDDRLLSSSLNVTGESVGETNEWLLKLSDVLCDYTQHPSKALFDYFVGRGPGLTPSGDDLLTGICALLFVLSNEHHPLFRDFKQYIGTYGSKRTTTVAYEYLSYVVREHAFHSSIHHLLEVFLQNNPEAWKSSISNLQQMGHTSGVDTLLGMIIVLHSYVKE